jgi:NADH-quinone oxidoreductase subunit E
MRVKRILNRETPQPEIKEDFDLSALDKLIDSLKNKKGNLIPLLQGTQDLFGYIPRDAFERIAQKTGHQLSDMYGVATFYTQFRLNPVGKYIIKVCHGTACHVQNAPAITEALQEELNVEDGKTTDDGLFTLESVACLGCCSLAPVMMINDETYGKLTGKSSVKILKEIKRKEKELN